MRGGEQGGLVLALLPQSTAPVPHTQQHVLKEGGALQGDDGPVVRPHAGLAVVRVLLPLCAAHSLCVYMYVHALGEPTSASA